MQKTVKQTRERRRELSARDYCRIGVIKYANRKHVTRCTSFIIHETETKTGGTLLTYLLI